MEDNIPVTRVEAIIEIDARVEAALQRWFDIRLPLEGGGAQHQGCPSARWSTRTASTSIEHF
jgi:hypothetical protein